MKGYERLLKNVRLINPPEGLYSHTLLRIRAAEQRRMRIWLSIIGFISLVSGGGIVATVIYTMQEFSHTGFSQYFSLLTSDSGTIVTYWKEFILLLIESLPVFAVALMLSSVFIFLISLRFALKNMRTSLLTV